MRTSLIIEKIGNGEYLYSGTTDREYPTFLYSPEEAANIDREITRNRISEIRAEKNILRRLKSLLLGE